MVVVMGERIRMVMLILLRLRLLRLLIIIRTRHALLILVRRRMAALVLRPLLCDWYNIMMHRRWHLWFVRMKMLHVVVVWQVVVP